MYLFIKSVQAHTINDHKKLKHFTRSLTGMNAKLS